VSWESSHCRVLIVQPKNKVKYKAMDETIMFHWDAKSNGFSLLDINTTSLVDDI